MSACLLTDKELRYILRVSQRSFTKMAHENHVLGLKPIVVQERRRWKASDVAHALGMSVDELLKALS